MVALLALSLTACGGDFPTATIDVGGHRVKVEVAATPELRARGLMYRDSLPADRGMLFVYADEAPRGFWMKNTRIPLDIGFASGDGTIVAIDHMKPLDTNTTNSVYPAKYALEMNKDWFSTNGVAVGAALGSLPDVKPE